MGIGGTSKGKDDVPINEGFGKLSLTDAILTLNNFGDNFKQIADQFDDIAKSNKDVSKYLKKRSFYDVTTGNRTAKGKSIDLLRSYSTGNNPMKMVAAAMKKSRASSVNDFFANPKNQIYARMLAKTGQSISNLITDSANRAIKGGATKDSDTMKAFGRLFYFSKGVFSTASKGGFMKDKIKAKDSSGTSFYTPLFASMHRKYDEKSGELSWDETQNSANYAFYHMLPYLRNFAKNAEEMNEALTSISASIGSIGNWLIPMGNALQGTSLGEIATILGNMENSGNQISKVFNGTNLGQYFKDRGDKFNSMFDSLFNDKESGSSFFNYFSRKHRSPSDFVTNPDGTMSFAYGGFGDTALGQKFASFKDRASGFLGYNDRNGAAPSDYITNKDGTMALKSGTAMGKLGGTLGKVLGVAMKTPIGAVLGVVGGVAKAAIGIFKFLAKSSPVLQAVESILNLFFTLFFMPIGNALGELLFPMLEGMIDWVLKWNDLWTNFSWDKFGGLLWEMFSTVVNWIISIPQAILNVLFELWDFVLSDIPLMLADFFDSVGLDGVADFFRNFGTIMGNVLTWFQNFFNNCYNGIKDFFSNPVKIISEAIGDIASNGVNAVGDWWHDLTGLASGGVVQPTPGGTIVRVAEGGEAEAIVPLSEMSGMGATYVININGDIYGMSDFETKVENVINRVSNRSAYR